MWQSPGNVSERASFTGDSSVASSREIKEVLFPESAKICTDLHFIFITT